MLALCCQGSCVQGGTRLKFSPSSEWWRESGRTGGCLAATGSKRVQRKTESKRAKVKKNKTKQRETTKEALVRAMRSNNDPPCSSAAGGCVLLCTGFTVQHRQLCQTLWIILQ